MIKYIISIAILIIAISTVSAGYWSTTDYEMNGTGEFTYPNHGWLQLESHDIDSTYNRWSVARETYGNIPYGKTLYIEGWGSMTKQTSTSLTHHVNHAKYYTSSWQYINPAGFNGVYDEYSGVISGNASPVTPLTVQFECGADSRSIPGYMHSYMSVYVSPTPFDTYTISGNIGCIDGVELYTFINNSYVFTGNNETDFYSFNVVDNQSYKLVFLPDAHTYMFTVDGDDIIYNYDLCIYTRYNFKESCGNLITDSEGFYIEKQDAVIISANDFHTASGILEIDNSSANNIYLSTDTFIGNHGWSIDPLVSDSTYNLTNSLIAWGLKVIVINQSNIDEKIDGATVRTNQSCYCTSGYSTRQKKTVGGMVSYNDMSLQDSSLWVHAAGYKILDENSTGYDAFLSGRANFSSKTWVVKLAPSNCNNSSEYFETSETVKIFFKNEAGQATSQIDDTDSLVYLYYHNNNSDGEDMTLRFESSSTHTYFTPEQSWNVPHGDIGRKTIVNADFTPYDYSYRAVMYNSTIYGWNLTIPLTVRDADAQTEQNYQNLSTFLWFSGAKDGKIDHRDDLRVGIHACSNNTTLMVVDTELYKDGSLLCYKNLTKTLLGDSYTYTWSPSYDYESGSVYTALMYGYDRTLLETAVVECITDTTTRKNKLTVIVKDRTGDNLHGATVFLETYGQTPCGSNYYAAYEGLDDDEYRYKAYKSGYTASGWETINITGDDEIVTYVLTAEGSSSGTPLSEKMADGDVKDIFFPFMYCLLAVIIIGGFKYVLNV